jgi:hypothetical protein
MNIAYVIAVLIPALVVSLVVYFLMLFVNNLAWGYKGLSMDKKSPEYKKRKRLLLVLSVPITISVITVWGVVDISKERRSSEEVQEEAATELDIREDITD